MCDGDAKCGGNGWKDSGGNDSGLDGKCGIAVGGTWGDGGKSATAATARGTKGAQTKKERGEGEGEGKRKRCEAKGAEEQQFRTQLHSDSAAHQCKILQCAFAIEVANVVAIEGAIAIVALRLRNHWPLRMHVYHAHTHSMHVASIFNDMLAKDQLGKLTHQICIFGITNVEGEGEGEDGDEDQDSSRSFQFHISKQLCATAVDKEQSPHVTVRVSV